MSSVNKVIVLGNLGKDPETRFAPSGDAITNLTVATSDTWKDKATGEKKEATEWHRVVLFGRTAEVASEYLTKGSQVYIEGRLKTRKWQDKDGHDRYTTEITGDVLKMIGKRDAQAPQQTAQPAQKTAQGESGFAGMDDDIPFMRFAAGAEWRVV